MVGPGAGNCGLCVYRRLFEKWSQLCPLSSFGPKPSPFRSTRLAFAPSLALRYMSPSTGLTKPKVFYEQVPKLFHFNLVSKSHRLMQTQRALKHVPCQANIPRVTCLLGGLNPQIHDLWISKIICTLKSGEMTNCVPPRHVYPQRKGQNH